MSESGQLPKSPSPGLLHVACAAIPSRTEVHHVGCAALPDARQERCRLESLPGNQSTVGTLPGVHSKNELAPVALALFFFSFSAPAGRRGRERGLWFMKLSRQGSFGTGRQ